jgi:hypothetical protein
MKAVASPCGPLRFRHNRDYYFAVMQKTPFDDMSNKTVITGMAIYAVITLAGVCATLYAIIKLVRLIF